MHAADHVRSEMLSLHNVQVRMRSNIVDPALLRHAHYRERRLVEHLVVEQL